MDFIYAPFSQKGLLRQATSRAHSCRTIHGNLTAAPFADVVRHALTVADASFCLHTALALFAALESAGLTFEALEQDKSRQFGLAISKAGIVKVWIVQVAKENIGENHDMGARDNKSSSMSVGGSRKVFVGLLKRIARSRSIHKASESRPQQHKTNRCVSGLGLGSPALHACSASALGALMVCQTLFCKPFTLHFLWSCSSLSLSALVW
jgi:hypothetical protein